MNKKDKQNGDVIRIRGVVKGKRGKLFERKRNKETRRERAKERRGEKGGEKGLECRDKVKERDEEKNEEEDRDGEKGKVMAHITAKEIQRKEKETSQEKQEGRKRKSKTNQEQKEIKGRGGGIRNLCAQAEGAVCWDVECRTHARSQLYGPRERNR